MTEDDLLAGFERKFGKPRSKWTSADWQLAARGLAHLCARAMKVAASSNQVASKLIESDRARATQGGLSAAERTAGLSHGLQATDAAQEGVVQAPDRDRCSKLVAAADWNLRQILASPFGREAYVRLSRDGRPEPKRLLQKLKGALPAAKGQLAMQLMAKPVVQPAAKKGRPPKAPDAEAIRWLNLFDKHAAKTGKPVQTTAWVRHVLLDRVLGGGSHVSRAQAEALIKDFARRITEERKRRQRLSGK